MDYIVVQAGGKGSRLGYLTENKPKALVPVDNLPMLFHLFRKYPTKKFIIIADYKKNVLREYLSAFAHDVTYQVVDAEGMGTCSGIRSALELLPSMQPFMLIWSDLILPESFALPREYVQAQQPEQNYVGLSQTFSCRWRYEDGNFEENPSMEHGVAGLFLFKGREELADVPENGEFVRWLGTRGQDFQTIGIGGTREFGILEEYEKLGVEKCRPFNRIHVDTDISGRKILIKEPIDAQGERLAVRECAWYEKAKDLGILIFPEIHCTKPLTMEFIEGKNIYESELSVQEKQHVLKKLTDSLKQLHAADRCPVDTFSIYETYYTKTMDRLHAVRDLIPFANEKKIRINGIWCRNIFFYKHEFEENIRRLCKNCDTFSFIHGDCTFSNIMLRDNGDPVLIDPRGYFGHTALYGDARYDWAKLYYSVVGNYDMFNLKHFRLSIGSSPEEGVKLAIDSNHWEDMEADFFAFTGSDPQEIKLLHAAIWLSLTTYAWQDYDSVCGAFYNGLWYLEGVL